MLRLIGPFSAVLLLVLAVAYFTRPPSGPKPIYLKGVPPGQVYVAQGLTRDAIKALAVGQGLTPMPPRLYFVAQYGRPLTLTERDSLGSALGIGYLDAIPANSYIISVPTVNGSAVLDEIVLRKPPALAIVAIKFEQKVSPALYTIPSAGDPPQEDPPAYVLRAAGGGATNHAYLIRFFADVSLATQRNILKTYTDNDGDAYVDAHVPVTGIWSVSIPAGNLIALAEEYEVQSIEPTTPPGENDMDEASGRVGIDAGVAETGSGVIIAQWELCQPDNTHDELNDVWLTETDHPDCYTANTDINNSHATLVAGVMTSDGAMFPPYKGIAPATRIVAFNVDQGPHPIDEYPLAIGVGATISTNSWGFEYDDLYSDVLAYPWLWYPVMAAHYDSVTSGRTAAGGIIGTGMRMLVVGSTGNYGEKSQWFGTRIANSAKNAITVGGVSSGQGVATDKPMSQGGRGPTADGRFSPVLVAPSIEHGIDWGIRSTMPVDTTGVSWGTSFSTPIVTGVAALVTEKFRNTCDGREPVPADIRGLMIHTARDLMNAEKEVWGKAGGSDLVDPWPHHPDVHTGNAYKGPDFIFGYGLPQADAAIEAVDKSNFLNDDIEQGLIDYPIPIETAKLDNGLLRVTLTWDDPPYSDTAGSPSAATGYLQNDLDLVVIDPKGDRYYPWILDVDNPELPATSATTGGVLNVSAGVGDHRNTIEQVEIEVPNHLLNQVWTIRVEGSSMLLGPQNFTLVSSVINPTSECGDIPSNANPLPPAQPDNPFGFLLLIIALVMLVILIYLLLRRMYRHYLPQGKNLAYAHIFLMLLFLLLVFYLLRRWAVVLLAVALAFLAIYA